MVEEQETREGQTRAEREEELTRVLSMDIVGEGKCPFRGYPNRYDLDSRCPTTVKCEMVQGKVAKEGGGYQGVLMAVPVVTADSYCGSTCLPDMVREKEAGMDVRPAPVSSGAKRAGVLQGRQGPKTTKAEAKARREQRLRLARKFLEEQGR